MSEWGVVYFMVRSLDPAKCLIRTEFIVAAVQPNQKPLSTDYSIRRARWCTSKKCHFSALPHYNIIMENVTARVGLWNEKDTFSLLAVIANLHIANATADVVSIRQIPPCRIASAFTSD